MVGGLLADVARWGRGGGLLNVRRGDFWVRMGMGVFDHAKPPHREQSSSLLRG